MELTILYISGMMLCAISLLILFFCNVRNNKNDYGNPIFWIYIMDIVSTLANVAWKLVDGNPDYITWNYIFNGVEYFGNVICSYFWFAYCCRFTLVPVLKKKKVRLLSGIPVFLATGLLISAPWNQWAIRVDAGGVYHRGDCVLVQVTAYVYMAVAAVFSLISYKRARFISQKKQYTTMVLYTVIPLVLGSIQFLMPPSVMPTLQYSVFLSLLLVYADEQERKITMDSLTHLPNRYDFERTLYERMVRSRREESLPLYVLVGDLDKFKEINDNYGHVEGDCALKITGKALLQVAQNYDAVAARISGDEFCMAVNMENEAQVEKMIGEITQKLQEYVVDKKYHLSISFGYTKFDGEKTLINIINEADKKMYENKGKKYFNIRR